MDAGFLFPNQREPFKQNVFFCYLFVNGAILVFDFKLEILLRKPKKYTPNFEWTQNNDFKALELPCPFVHPQVKDWADKI